MGKWSEQKKRKRKSATKDGVDTEPVGQPGPTGWVNPNRLARPVGFQDSALCLFKTGWPDRSIKFCMHTRKFKLRDSSEICCF